MKTAAALAILALVIFPRPALACACCSEPGQRIETQVNLDSGLRDDIEQLKFAPAASLYADAGFPQSVKGVAGAVSKPYQLAVKRETQAIILTFTDAVQKSGEIRFPLPPRMTRFEIDTRIDSAKSQNSAPQNGGPSLYKEWRLEGPAMLDGIFSAQKGQSSARLIFHGAGNGCTTSADFTRWTLSVRGAGAEFMWLGEFLK